MSEGHPEACKCEACRDAADRRNRLLTNIPPWRPGSAGAAPVGSTDFCGKACDHGSPCLLYADHQPPDRHETQHGCIFYDTLPTRMRTADGRKP